MTTLRTTRRAAPTLLGMAAWLTLAAAGANAAPTDFVAITAGAQHTCAMRANGRTYCWGLDNIGQAGVAATAQCGSAGCVPAPRYVKDFSQIDAGEEHTCALDAAGKAWCWGNNWSGQTGVPSYTEVREPTRVQGNLTFSTISAGMQSSCGVAGSQSYCWGYVINANGSNKPTAVAAFAPFQSITAGYVHACALYTGGGTVGQVSCFGNNNYGQAAENPQQYPRAMIVDMNLFDWTVKRVVSQMYTTCAEMQNGMLMCAGENYWGQLGNGSTANNYIPQAVGNGMQLRGVAMGSTHMCALDPANRAWCWGNNGWGELGNGNTTLAKTPVLVAGGTITFRAIAAGGQHTCGIATNNTVYCWGRNSYGQLGIDYVGSWFKNPQAIYNMPL